MSKIILVINGITVDKMDIERIGVLEGSCLRCSIVVIVNCLGVFLP